MLLAAYETAHQDGADGAYVLYMLAFCQLALAFSGPAVELEQRYHCAACDAHREFGAGVCEALGSCAWAVEEDCAAACAMQRENLTAAASQTKLTAATVQLRVSKGFGTKPYSTLRVSAITAASEPAPFAAEYSAPFKYKWTQFALHSSVISVPAGSKFSFKVDGQDVPLFLPAQGAGAAGVLIADPCMKASKVGCDVP